jgi:hypothetical protein
MDGRLRDRARATTQQDLARFWQALHDRRINRRSTFAATEVAFEVARFGGKAANCPKISRNRKTCGKKDTASVPQRGTGV